MTPERFHRLRRALERRQPDLSVIAEGVHKPHNLSAVIRTCDAVGVLMVHAVTAQPVVEPFAGIASGAQRWVQVRPHPTVEDAVAAVRERGLRILAAHPSPTAVDFRRVGYTRPCAILLGQEKEGITPRGLACADQLVTIPMLGLGRSLNVSVAAALILFEAARQRQEAGLYEASRLAPERFHQLLFEWAYPGHARRCREHGVPYPPLSPAGAILGEVPRGKPPRDRRRDR
jgi:tRNA (guanosine-2'-O-)-methyltransferase